MAIWSFPEFKIAPAKCRIGEGKVEEKSIDRDRATTNAIDRSNLDIFGTIWNNDDMSLFIDIFRYFLDIF
jgi:hypothetical protein